MINEDVYNEAASRFAAHFGRRHTIASYAPGRVEVLGNHTDYNEGFVLSAAINFGTFFLAAPADTSTCRLMAGDLMSEVSFDIDELKPLNNDTWANYVIGVVAGLAKKGPLELGFDGMFLGNVPLGAGLSSSAALEISTGLALCELYDIHLDTLDLALIGQAAEHEYAGVKCGLLDQISSLSGKDSHLVMTDFRSMAVENVPIGDDACFLMCNTHAKHSLEDGEYNERRQKCEEAARFFAGVLDHKVSALRDVNWEEWEAKSSEMDPVAAKRAAHVIGENTRVLRGRELLADGNLEEFGKLMFESHHSSRVYFENSCDELDFIVSRSLEIPGVMGARLSGGGFGGSAVCLVHPRDVETVRGVLAAVYEKELGSKCDIRVILPSAGAQIVT